MIWNLEYRIERVTVTTYFSFHYAYWSQELLSTQMRRGSRLFPTQCPLSGVGERLRPGFNLSSSPIKTSGPPGLDRDPEPTVRSLVSLWLGKLRSKLGCLGWDGKVEWWVASFLSTQEASHFLWCWKDQTFSDHKRLVANSSWWSR